MNELQRSQMYGFLKDSPVKLFKKQEIIMFQGEAPRSAYVIKKGVVKAYNLSSSGDEKPVAFYDEHDVLPASWVFGIVPSAVYYYEAFTDVELFCVSREAYLTQLKSNPHLLFTELEKHVTDEVSKMMRLNALQQSRASDKLVYTLHYLALSHGRRIQPNLIEITLTLTHQDFANLTGLTRETTATELNRLKTHGVISYDKHSPYRLRTDKLNAMINDQFLADLKIEL